MLEVFTIHEARADYRGFARSPTMLASDRRIPERSSSTIVYEEMEKGRVYPT